MAEREGNLQLGSSNLGRVSREHRQKLERNVHLLLLWIADSDGWLKEAELEFMANQFPVVEEAKVRELLAIIRNGEPKPLERAIRMLRDEDRELRCAFLDLCITVAKVDKKVAVTENHILRFYADALNLSSEFLERRFRLICGTDLEELSEPVAPDTSVQPDDSGSGMTVNEACALLGVQFGATGSELEHAYRKLSEYFLKQRVEAMGAAAIAVARKRSRKLKDAYNLLMGDAYE